uniref:Uncharacterized protein n=1 Tax=Micrurus paraensis TaxID=1970185 RepID=A0A2D4KSH6_9SAUR
MTLYIKDWILAKEIFRDNEGRILMVEIELGNRKVLLVVIYVPNGPQETFFQKLYNRMKDLQYKEICILSDFNTVVDKILDYKGNNTRLEMKKTLPIFFYDLMKGVNIYDAWRERNPGKKTIYILL